MKIKNKRRDTAPAARAEAERLNALGYVTIRWQNHIALKVRFEEVRGLVMGYALDSQGRDCYLIRTANRNDDGKFVVRCVPIRQITMLDEK